MNGNRAPLLLLLAAMLALLPLSLDNRGEAGPAAGSVSADPAAAPAETQPTPVPSRWFGHARLIAEITGEPWDGKADPEPLWQAFAEKARAADFARFDPLIALLPCPVDSNLAADFDQAVAALQEAYADAGYLLAGWWLPWSADAATDRTHEDTPGLMIFRRHDRPELAVVLVVGEVPARGLHRAAFREAVETLQRWQAPGPLTVRVLGPSLSDSALSLWLAIKKLGPEAKLELEVVSGTARAASVQKMPWNDLRPTTRFHLSVVPEGEMQTRARRFFEEDMGWKLRRIALLTEADRAYGQPYLTPENVEDSTLVHFPPGIAGVRNAWDRDQRPRETSPAPGSLPLPETTLDLRLGDLGRPVIVPEQSSLTAAGRDLAIANLLATLSDRRISYVGVLASDPRDAAFLVDRIRRFAPSALLFLVNNDLLFTHPRLGPTMNGTLVISGFPLFAGNEPVRLPPPGASDQMTRRYLSQFTSDLHQGVYLAAQHLIALGHGHRPPEQDRSVWVTAVGNGSLWPLASLAERPVELCRPWLAFSAGKAAVKPGVGDRLSARAGTKLLVSSLAILFLALMLTRFARPPEQAGGRAWWLLAGAASTLGLAAGVLLVLGSLPYRRLDIAWNLPEWQQNWKVPLAGFVLAIAAASLVAIVVRAVGKGKGRRRKLWLLAEVLLLAALVLFFLDPLLCRLWMVGGFEYFLRRAFTFSSGLSPLVSLAWLGGALYLWAFTELRRERMQARQQMDWPGDGPRLPAFERCRRLAGHLQVLLHGPWPRWTVLCSPSWWVVVLPFFLSLPFLAFLFTVHPIAEPRAWGFVFLLLLAFTFFLAAYSFCRFLGAWMLLRRILHQLALPSPPVGLDNELATEVKWNPMKSFGWQIPRFAMAHLLKDEVQRLVEAGTASRDLAARVGLPLEAAYTACRDGDFEEELAARQALSTIFANTYREIAGKNSTFETERFTALYLIAYIRYVFAHLRGFLISAGVCGFPLLAAASTYAFEPDELVSNGIWAWLLVAVVATVGVFLMMDRNPILSLVSGTTPGEVQPSLQLFQNILTYGVVPVLGLVASQFPQVGRYMVSLINPLLRVVGGGP